MEKYILVIGAMLLDTKGKPAQGLEPSTSNPAFIRSTRGGSARNVAENLARLGANVQLVSAVGDDQTGLRLIDSTAVAGVDMSYVRILEGQRTGSYIAILDAEGSLSVALDDVGVMTHVSGQYLYQHRKLVRDAALVMVDGSLTPGALNTVVQLTQKYHIPLCADPSSTRFAPKLQPHLSALSLAVPNEVEAAALCDIDFEGFDPESSEQMARKIVQKGVDTAVVTLSDFGLAYATTDETGYIPGRYTEMVDTTGTGDALTAAIMFGIYNELPVMQSIRLGAAAASLTLQTSRTVVADLNLDMLYEHLIV